MGANIVSGGRMRLHLAPEIQARRRAMATAVKARWAEKLRAAGWWKGLALRWKMNAEIKREWRRLDPSDQALFVRTRKSCGRAGSDSNS
jgi:hypothetical protein